ncbi:DUF551 domain-containing protein [Klebsiella variicola]|uniref:DUF551 domain-containing protein n=1 Tax=Klebsiella variicola TaxID=244366 RepID=UPI003CD01C8C
MALAAMDSESGCLPLDYLQGHKDGLECAAQLAEANHPETGDWLYDDPIELAKAIRKGPDMPPAQPAADSEPVAINDQANLDYLRSGADADVWPPEREEMGDVLLYRHAQPATVVPVVPVENHIGSKNALDAIVSFIKGKSNPTVKCYEEVSEQLFKDNCHGIHSHVIEYILKLGEELEDLRAEQAEMQPVPVVPVCTCRSGDGSLRWPCPVHPGSSPVIPDTWIPVSERLPENKPGSYEYLVFETLNNRVNHDYWNVPDKGDDAFTPFWNYYGGHVTHWMPLPAAPQEGK